MATQFSLATMSAYTDQQKKEIFAKMLMGFESLNSEYIKVVDTIKETTKLKYMDVTATFQDASNCGFNASGAVTLSEKTFGVNKLKWETSLCSTDLDGYSFETFLKPGFNNEIPVELMNKIIEIATTKVSGTIENQYWTAATGATVVYGGGLLVQAALDANATARTFNWNSAQTSATIIAEVEAIFNALPAEIQNEAIMFCGYDVFNKINQAYLKGYYSVSIAAGGLLPGTTMKIYPVTRLATRAFATSRNNLVYLTDLKEEIQTSRIWYSMDNDLINVSIKFRAGAGYHFGEYIVYTKIA